MHHRVFSSFWLFLLISFFFSSISNQMQGQGVDYKNINGGRDRLKRDLVKEVVQQKKLDVILLQEIQ